MSDIRIVTSSNTYGPKNPHWLKPVMIVVACVLLSIAGIVIARAFDGETFDSGARQCQKMADNVKNPKPENNKHWTEDDYHKARKPFENSKYPDLKVAGTNIVDSIYKMDQDSLKSSDDPSLSDSLGMLSTINTQWSALQVACAKAGVDLPGLS